MAGHILFTLQNNPNSEAICNGLCRCKDWGGPGPAVDQPAEMKQLKSCRNLPTAYKIISYKPLPRIFLPQ